MSKSSMYIAALLIYGLRVATNIHKRKKETIEFSRIKQLSFVTSYADSNSNKLQFIHV